MKIFCFIVMLFFIVNCAGKIEADISKIPSKPAKVEEKLSVEVFSLTYHKVIGTCDSLPISHRMLMFSYIPLEKNNDDYFVGSLEILLDENAKTYQALYREFPGASNLDQTDFQTILNGSFTVVKAATADANDTMILENLGVLTPTINGNKINFFITFEKDINRVIVQNEALGRVYFKGTSLVSDNCLL